MWQKVLKTENRLTISQRFLVKRAPLAPRWAPNCFGQKLPKQLSDQIS